MKVHMNDARAITAMKLCIMANPDKGNTGQARNDLTKFIFIFARCSDREGPS